MLVKITLLFLLGMALVAMLGRAFFPTALRRMPGATVGTRPTKCPRCGAFIVGQGPCVCSKKVSAK